MYIYICMYVYPISIWFNVSYKYVVYKYNAHTHTYIYTIYIYTHYIYTHYIYMHYIYALYTYIYKKYIHCLHIHTNIYKYMYIYTCIYIYALYNIYIYILEMYYTMLQYIMHLDMYSMLQAAVCQDGAYKDSACVSSGFNGDIPIAGWCKWLPAREVSFSWDTNGYHIHQTFSLAWGSLLGQDGGSHRYSQGLAAKYMVSGHAVRS